MTKVNYLAIAPTTACNYDCFYCRPLGESESTPICKNATMDWKKLKMVIDVAYSRGITIFRITGGEPTMVDYLPELIQYIMELGEDTKIRINTNGYKLEDEAILSAIRRYKTRMDIVISVDSVSEHIGGIHFPKYLSPTIRALAKKLVCEGIPTRFNVVVTKHNIEEVNRLIDEALTLGVNVKILDLIVREDYNGIGGGRLIGNDATEFGKSIYVSLSPITEHLNKISNQNREKFHTWNGNGIQMGGYFFGKLFVQVKDSTKGTQYSKRCIEECPHFDVCREGLFSLFLSAGGHLHISNCQNQEWRFDLNGKSEADINAAFESLSLLFQDTTIIKK